MTASRMDELVAGLASVHDNQVADPFTPGARDLLVTIMTQKPASAIRSPRHHRHRRFTLSLAMVTAMAVFAVIALNTGGSDSISDYANAAVDIERTDDDYRVHVKDLYADQRQFRDAFSKLGLEVTLSIVPVSPRYEGQIISLRTTGNQIATVLTCPPSQRDSCPLTLKLSGKTARQGPTELMIGRAARPGETYRNQHPGTGDNPPSLKLTGHPLAEALVRLRGRSITATYMLGRFDRDGSGSAYTPPTGWRPQTDRRVTGAWMNSSTSVTLLFSPLQNDPPRPLSSHDQVF